MKALLIPADPSRKVEQIEVDGVDDLRQRVGGLPEPTRYDTDAIMFVSDTGRIDGKPMNARATEYIKNESEAARQGRAGQGDPSYGLYGDVVVVGDGGFAGMRDVPTRLVEQFRADIPLQVDHEKDNRRQIRGNEDGMIRIPWPRDRKGPYVIEVTEPGGEQRYLSAAGLHNDGPMVDALSEAATFERKGDAKHFAFLAHDHITHHGEHDFDVDTTITVVAERKALEQQRVVGCERYEEPRIHPVIQGDLRNVVKLASEIEDRTPHEQASLDRLQQSLDQSLDNGPGWSR
jgi:Domain of unknown function (DUF3846)